jgi:serine-type D-Ala-D-Ala carboxypeptidase (penicillin-binding protein 5/6)
MQWMYRKRKGVALLFATLLILLAVTPAVAAAEVTFTITSRSALLMDAVSGQILFEKDGDARYEPASLTKIMTAYLAFQAIKDGVIDLDDPVLISERAWMTGGSKMFVMVGDNVRFEDLLKGMTVSSGNDACVAIAERLGGTEAGFVAMMNDTAERLGMTNTQFRNPHGLPAEGHYTSARDIAVLSRRHILDNPEALVYHSMREFQYGIDYAQPNRNRLLWTYPGADGLKTGSTTAAGFCLVGTAEKEGDRFIAVIMGGASDPVRTSEAGAMLDYAFAHYTTVPIAAAGDTLQELRVWQGEQNLLSVGATDLLALTVAKGSEDAVTVDYELDRTLRAPLSAGQVVGDIILRVDGEEVRREPAVALTDMAAGGFFRRTADSIRFFFARMFRRV